MNKGAEPIAIYEHKNFLAVMKPAGLLVHGTKVKSKKEKEKSEEKGEGEATLVDWLLRHYPEVKDVGDDPSTRPGIVHRLDKETSGVLLIARNQKYFEYLKSLFKERRIVKTYLAVVTGVPKKVFGVIDAPIGIKNGTTKHSTFSKKMAKEAITEYRVLGSGIMNQEPRTGVQKSWALLEVVPKTGRTHQIRVHLASIGHPVIGDTLYGRTFHAKLQPPPHLMLHALSVEFETEPGKRMKIEAEPPPYFDRFIHHE